MPDDSRVQQLLDELLDLQTTPEEVCVACPELLPQVRDRWRQVCRARAELDAFFPPVPEPGDSLPKSTLGDTSLPVIPDHEVLSMLGLGGMGVVFQARHLRLKRVVALKMALVGAYAGPHERERFQREAEAVAALRHPNVVQIYEVGEADGRPYFTMEYLDGGSLAQKLAGTPQPASRSAALLLTLAEAVHSAHQAGIVHRDLKPANVLLTNDGMAKISDFGLARRLGGEAGLTRTGTAVGTPSYMAPEQALGAAHATGPAVDIYSLGAILYEMLTGRPPFLAETVAQTVLQLLSRDPIPPSKLVGKVPRDLETICLKCLHKEPRLRYATADELAEDLRRFQVGLPIHARRLGWGGRVWRWGWRNPATAALVAAISLLIGSALGVGLWMQQQEASRREETARKEERAWQTIEATLDKSAALREQGRWPEMRAALEGTEELLGPSAPTALRQRVRRARADADMVAELEEIRLRLSTGGDSRKPISLTPEAMYAQAFQQYEVDLLVLDPAEAALRIRGSAIRETLLAFLHDWLFWTTDTSRERVRVVIEQADDDEWRREFRAAMAATDKKKLKDLAVASESGLQPPVVLSGLGGTLLAYNQRAEALTLLSEAQKRHPGDFWINYLIGHYWDQDQPQQAVGYFRAAVAIRPTSDQAYRMLGRALRASGDTEGTITAFRKATALNPTCDVARDLAMLLVPKGELEEARVVWGKFLEETPPHDDSWYGYAQLCLFLKNQDAYRSARKALLAHCEHATPNWIADERTSLACLLLPASEDELHAVNKLVDRTVAGGPMPPDKDAAYIQFVQGMAEYRQGHADQAIPLLQQAAPILSNRAGPQLALAMALFQTGSVSDARRTLATALLAFDWKESQQEPVSMWVNHTLRREAESLILPNLVDFVRGEYRPQDDAECDALLGASQFINRPFAVTQRYVDAIAASPSLVENLQFDHLYHAACCAAQAAEGDGEDLEDLAESARSRLRSQAHTWLQKDLAVCCKALDVDFAGNREKIRRQITLWRVDPDLAGLRESAELEKLPEDERKDCITFWREVEALLKRCESLN